jgi:phosphoribosylanthranilate isomerase
MIFRIKICGITRVQDAIDAVEAGADAIGLNFYAPSPRAVTPAAAVVIAKVVPASVQRVGVFVNASLDEIRSVLQQVPLDHVQLHGDEAPEMVQELAPVSCLRAFRLRGDAAQWEREIAGIQAYGAACASGGNPLEAVLLDAHAPGQFGGTGVMLDWTALAERRTEFGPLPVVLAGGLRPENVAQAILQVQPAGVDTASGVESAPGIKERHRVFEFVASARKAFSERGLP